MAAELGLSLAACGLEDLATARRHLRVAFTYSPLMGAGILSALLTVEAITLAHTDEEVRALSCPLRSKRPLIAPDLRRPSILQVPPGEKPGRREWSRWGVRGILGGETFLGR
jgi:hypothetical protein